MGEGWDGKKVGRETGDWRCRFAGDLVGSGRMRRMGGAGQKGNVERIATSCGNRVGGKYAF